MIAQRASFLVGGIYTSGGKLQQYFYDDSGKSKMIDIDTLREISTLIICFQKKDYASKKATTDAITKLLSHLTCLFWRQVFNFIYPPISEVKRLVSHVASQAINRQ